MLNQEAARYYIFSGKQPFHSMEVDEILDAFGRGEEPRPEVQCLSRELGALLAEAWHSEAGVSGKQRSLARAPEKISMLQPFEACCFFPPK